MNITMTTNSQLSTTEYKKKQTKQTTRTEAESQKWRSHGGLSVGGEGWGVGGKVQGIRSIIGRYKTDRRMSRTV